MDGNFRPPSSTESLLNTMNGFQQLYSVGLLQQNSNGGVEIDQFRKKEVKVLLKRFTSTYLIFCDRSYFDASARIANDPDNPRAVAGNP